MFRRIFRDIVKLQPRTFYHSQSYIKNHIPIKQNEMITTTNDNIPQFLKEVYPYFNKENHITIPTLTFTEAKSKLDKMSNENDKMKCYYGNGFYPCFMVEHLKQNFLTNPNFYSAYIPYQSEISQGRLELLYNYQTMVCNLTKMDIANCSLLDESSAAAEAMLTLIHSSKKKANPRVFIDTLSYTQHKDVIHTRAKSLSIPTYEIHLSDLFTEKSDVNELPQKNDILFFQHQNKNGDIQNIKEVLEEVSRRDMKSVVVMDSLASTIFEPPGTYGADIVIGSTQRFGLPMWNGGPHAAFFAAKETYLRHIPGRIVGKSIDNDNEMGYRLALQSREQHIKKDRASSNICTSQALLANYNVLYAMYYGPSELKERAKHIYYLTEAFRSILIENLHEDSYIVENNTSFDTIRIRVVNTSDMSYIYDICNTKNYLLSIDKSNNLFTITLDETKTIDELIELADDLFSIKLKKSTFELVYNIKRQQQSLSIGEQKRVSDLLPQSQFNVYNNEHKITRYLTDLQKKDLSLTHSMIPLGSCTMKLNSADVLSSLLDKNWCDVHPFTPFEKQVGYQNLIHEMKEYLCNITGLDDISFQSNSGATGEYSALCVFKDYFKTQNEEHRDICIIPDSAHGTNFASAILAGYKIKKVKSRKDGSLDVEHLQEIILNHRDRIACMMITFPSTFGFFEESTPDVLKMVKDTGAKIYCDGANMNAFLGLINLGDMGIDACHMNLHKTFTIPHGGGGPGLGPIAVTKELSPFLPSNQIVPIQEYSSSYGAISSAPFSSASLLTIPYLYISMCGGNGLRECSIQSLLSANYMKEQLEDIYRIPYTNRDGKVSHEFIIDIHNTGTITEKDICKRLMDYGFHGPTMSWPVASSLMIEPTESEDKDELDRFIHSMKSIKNEIDEVKNDETLKESNVLVNAPHSQNLLYKDWDYPYSKDKAYFPLDFIKERKFTIPVSRINDAYGDRNINVKDD